MGKIKGSVVLSAVKVLRMQKDDAKKALEPALHHYLQERIVVAAWYPEDDFLALVVACSTIYPAERETIFEKMGSATARYHFDAGGLYANLLGRDTAQRAKVIW